MSVGGTNGWFPGISGTGGQAEAGRQQSMWREGTGKLKWS